VYAGDRLDECRQSCTATFTQVQSCAADISSAFQIARSGLAFNLATNRFMQTLTLTNGSALAIAGPVSIALDGLPAAVSLTNLAGLTACNPAHLSMPGL